MPGNGYSALNGDDAFPAMLAAIDGATQSISLVSYILKRSTRQTIRRRCNVPSTRGVPAVL